MSGSSYLVDWESWALWNDIYKCTYVGQVTWRQCEWELAYGERPLGAAASRAAAHNGLWMSTLRPRSRRSAKLYILKLRAWPSLAPSRMISFFVRRCPWCNGYRRRKWTRRHEFKSWTKLITFHIVLIPLGKVWIQLFSLQLWVNSRADWILQPWWGN